MKTYGEEVLLKFKEDHVFIQFSNVIIGLIRTKGRCMSSFYQICLLSTPPL